MTALKTLKILRFRKVEPGTTLRFREGYNILLGKNATGKTTLLELIANAISLDLSAYSNVPFKIEFELSSDTRTLRVEAENVEVDAGFRRSVRRGPGSVPHDVEFGEGAFPECRLTGYSTNRYAARSSSIL